MWTTQMLLVLAAASVRREMTMVGGCKTKGPGAEQEPAGGGQHGTVAGEAPFQTVEKDGYWHVNCLADAMNRKGDKFGGGAQRYEGGAVADSSVVRYDVVVEPDARQKMSPQVCFNFCRTVPDMTFFGLVYGRECYCTHFYKQTTGDGVCDLPCDGDSAVTCGGQTMSDIYQMHECVGGFAEKVAAMQEAATAVNGALAETAMAAQGAGDAMQASGDYLEGLAEGAASPLAQAAKVAAGPVIHSGEDLLALSGEFGKLEAEATGLDASDSAQREELEAALAQGTDLLDASDQALAAAEQWVTDTAPEISVPEGTEATFVPVLRQLDPEKAGLMSVCNGQLTGTPKVGLSVDECVASCDAHPAPAGTDGYCYAVQHFNLQGADSLCYLFSGLSELTSYDCEWTSHADGAKGFLQKSEKKHKKHHRKHKHARKHAAKKHTKRAPLLKKKLSAHSNKLSAHPSSRFMVQMHLKYTAARRSTGGEEATCMVRFADVVGVTPEFKDGVSHLNRCFAAE